VGAQLRGMMSWLPGQKKAAAVDAKDAKKEEPVHA
jgi:hypothetical protein